MARKVPLVAELRVDHGRVVTFHLGDIDMLDFSETVEPDQALETISFEASSRSQPVGVRFTGDLPDGVPVDDSGMTVCLPDGTWIPWTGEAGITRRDTVPVVADDEVVDRSGFFAPLDPTPVPELDDGTVDEAFAWPVDDTSDEDVPDEEWVTSELMNPDKASSGVSTIRTAGTMTASPAPASGRWTWMAVLGVLGVVVAVLGYVVIAGGGTGPATDADRPVAGPGRLTVKPADVPTVSLDTEATSTFRKDHKQLWRTKLGDAGGVSATPFAVVIAQPGGLRFLNPKTGRPIATLDVTGPIDMLTWTESGSHRLVVWQQGRTLRFFEPSRPKAGVAVTHVPRGTRVSTLSTGMLLSADGKVRTVKVGAGRKLKVSLTSAGAPPSPTMSCFAVTRDGDCLWAARTAPDVAVGSSDPVRLASPGTGLVRTSWVALSPTHALTLWSASRSPSTGAVPVVAAIHDMSTGKLDAVWQTTWSAFAGARMFEESSSSGLVAYGPLVVDLDEGTFRARTDIDATSFVSPVGGVPVLLTDAGPATVDGDLVATPVDGDLLVGLPGGVVVARLPGGVLAGFGPKGT